MKLFFAAILVAGISVSVGAEKVAGAAIFTPLLIDFQGVGGNTRAGYQPV
jgi:hypothetical protein